MLQLKPLLIALGLSIATFAFAAPPHGGGPGTHRGPPPPHEVIRKHAAELGIHADTVTAIVNIAEDERTEMEALRQAKHQEARKLHQMLSSETPNRDAVMQQVDVLSNAERAQKKHHLNILMDIRALLTPEQRKAIEELHQRMKRDRPRSQGPRGPGGGGGPRGEFRPRHR